MRGEGPALHICLHQNGAAETSHKCIPPSVHTVTCGGSGPLTLRPFTAVENPHAAHLPSAAEGKGLMLWKNCATMSPVVRALFPEAGEADLGLCAGQPQHVAGVLLQRLVFAH
ncbi:hypothetical protein SKAU_G00097070 [Synaphobranchus kaupii]|uniref:Uncharacterized protein n=1 Tax=Synaphobranchus kaupii TaxID=118154 RepID=A0A9Q1J6R9_SYNKA|nr:hypothetical protein SKAU_G00097070 [Synaphobranchus kaupii]